MLSIWIIHRDPKARAAIARMSGIDERAVLAAPTDRVLDRADAPTVVVLGLSGDFEIELDFVHRHAARLTGCDWILLASASDVSEARRLFDTLPGRILTYPPEARDLRRALRASVQQRRATPLSARRGRAELQERFGRWFGDLELPELIRALDPRLARVPVLIHGEEGTGRGLLARYIHLSTGRPEHALVQITCSASTSAEDLLGQMRLGDDLPRSAPLTLYLEDVDRLPTTLQRHLRDWIEFGLPDGGKHRHGQRFMASAASARDIDAEPGLDPRLAETLSGLTIALPPLRERTEHVASFVSHTATALARARGESTRHFSPDALARLAAYPWPGNLHELEAVVTRTLSYTQAEPIEPIHLRFPADMPWLDARLGRADLEPETAGAASSEHGPETAGAASSEHETVGAASSEHETETVGEPIEDLAPHTVGEAIDEARADAAAAHGAPDIARPTAFPRPSPETLSVPIAGEPIEDFPDLEPAALPHSPWSHDEDLDVGRVARLGDEPLSADVLDDDLSDRLSREPRRFREPEPFQEPRRFHEPEPFDETGRFDEEGGLDEEDLFPDDDLEDLDFETDEIEDADEASPGDRTGHRAASPAEPLTAEPIDDETEDDASASEIFAEVELIEDPNPEPEDVGTGAASGAPDARPGFDPGLEYTEVEASELLPDVEPLEPPVRPLPEAGEGDAVAATLAADALPFDEPFEPRTEATKPASEGHESVDPRLYELVGAIAHEVRNPLVSIRTFSELLPDHYDDPEFRSHFRELVVKDVQRIDRVVSRLQSLAEGQRKPEPVDVARMLDRLLDERRPVIQSRRLLVLKELDHTQPLVLADAEQIEDAISGLLDRAIDQASERGDVYLASKYDERGLGGRPSVRVLVRHTRASGGPGTQATGRARVDLPSSDQALLDLVLARRLVEAQGGQLSVDDAEAGESVIVVDLPSA